jgi:NTE family protein
MREHWTSGLEDIRRSFAHPEWFDIPSREIGFVTRDVHRYRQEANDTMGPVKELSPQSKRSLEEKLPGAK